MNELCMDCAEPAQFTDQASGLMCCRSCAERRVRSGRAKFALTRETLDATARRTFTEIPAARTFTKPPPRPKPAPTRAQVFSEMQTAATAAFPDAPTPEQAIARFIETAEGQQLYAAYNAAPGEQAASTAMAGDIERDWFERHVKPAARRLQEREPSLTEAQAVARLFATDSRIQGEYAALQRSKRAR